MNDHPALTQLLQAYLHLDWPEDYGDPWAAIDDFLRSEPEQAARLAGEIDRLLGDTAEEAELRRLVVGELGSGYLPEADGWSFASWLAEIAWRAMSSGKTSPKT